MLLRLHMRMQGGRPDAYFRFVAVMDAYMTMILTGLSAMYSPTLSASGPSEQLARSMEQQLYAWVLDAADCAPITCRSEIRTAVAADPRLPSAAAAAVRGLRMLLWLWRHRAVVDSSDTR